MEEEKQLSEIQIKLAQMTLKSVGGCCQIRSGIRPSSKLAGERGRKLKKPADTSDERTVVIKRAELESWKMVQQRSLARCLEAVDDTPSATPLKTAANGQMKQSPQPKKNRKKTRKKNKKKAKAQREMCSKTRIETGWEVVYDWDEVQQIAKLEKLNLRSFSIKPLYLMLLAHGTCHSRMQEFYECVELDRVPLTAAERLTTGRLIAMEEAHCWVVYSLMQRYTRCDWCLLHIPLRSLACDGCNLVMYCSTDCKQLAWKSYHQLECQLMAKLTGNELSVYFMAIVRCLCMTLGQFQFNYAAMRSYFLDKKPFVQLNLLDSNNMSERDLYCAKLCKPPLGWLNDKPAMRLLVANLHGLISQCLNDQIVEAEDDSFLESCIEWHVHYGDSANWIKETLKYDANCNTIRRRKSYGTYPLLAMMQSSCNPNVAIFNVTPKIRAAFVMKTIAKGEPLSVQCACTAYDHLYAACLEDSSAELQQETPVGLFEKQQAAAAKVNGWGIVYPPYSKEFWRDMKTHLNCLRACFTEHSN